MIDVNTANMRLANDSPITVIKQYKATLEHPNTAIYSYAFSTFREGWRCYGFTNQTQNQSTGMSAECTRRALAFDCCVQICRMFFISKCRGGSDLGLCTTSVTCKNIAAAQWRLPFSHTNLPQQWHARALATCLPRQDHVWITTYEFFYFHKNKFDFDFSCFYYWKQ